MTASSGPIAASEDSTQPAAEPPAPRRSPWHRRWWLRVIAWVLGVVAAFACYLRLADTRAVNSDGSGQALQAWDMLHGNLLLHGWQLTDITMYTTELPEYMLVELVRGLNTGVVHVAATVTYVLVVALAALLAKGRATGRAALVRVLITVGIMVAPQLSQGINILISSPDHFGTSVPLLLLWLIVDRAGRRWYVPVVVAVLLAWTTFADSLVVIIGVLPLAVVCAVRVLRAVRAGQTLKAQWYELGLGAGALVGCGIAELALHHLPANGFTLGAVDLHLASPATLPHHVNLALQGLLLLGGADFIGQPVGVASAVMVLHLVGVALAALGVVAALAQFARGKDLVDDVLVSAVVFNVVAYVLSTLAVAVFASREFDPVLPFAAVLAGRLLADRVLAMRLVPAVLLVVLAGYLGGLGYELAQPPVPAQNQQLATWLEQHHFHLGLSGYWQSSVVTLATQERVRVLQVVVPPGQQRVVPYVWEVKRTWFDPRSNTANFVVLAPTVAEYTGFTDKSAVLATFGAPRHDYHVGPYQILVYSKNLLTDLRGGLSPQPRSVAK